MPVTPRASYPCPSVPGVLNTAELQTGRHPPSSGGGDDTPRLDGEREPPIDLLAFTGLYETPRPTAQMRLFRVEHSSGHGGPSRLTLRIALNWSLWTYRRGHRTIQSASVRWCGRPV